MEDDIDIYGDLPELGKPDDGILSTEEKFVKEEDEQLKIQVAKLSEELQKSEKAKASLEVNLWALLKTAKAELARKDRTISELRSKLDNFAFRRGPHARQHTQYQQVAPVQSFQPVPAFQHVNNVVGYDFQAAQEIFPPSQGYPACKKEEEETDEDVRLRKEQLAKASNTVFGARLRKRLEEEEQQEKKEKSNVCVEKVTESDKENDLSSHKRNQEIVEPVIPESNETKSLNVKTDDDQALSKRIVQPNARCSAKRAVEEEVEVRHNKRKKPEKHEVDIATEEASYSEFSDHNYYKSQNYNNSKKRNKSTFEHDRFYNEHKKYRYVDEIAGYYEDKDSTYEHHRYLDKHAHSKRHSPEVQRTVRGKTNPPSRLIDLSHHKDKNDYRSDPDYNHRHRNKHKEDHHTHKYDRHTSQMLYNDEYEQNNHWCKNTRSNKRENRDNFKYKDERFTHRDSHSPRISTRKLCERYSSERTNEYAIEGIHKEFKCKRRNSMSNTKSEEQRRKVRNTVEIVKPEFMESNRKSPKRRSVSIEKLIDVPESDYIEKVDGVNDTPVQEKTIDSSMMEEGELPSTPDFKARPLEFAKTEELIENEEKKEEHEVPKEIENVITASTVALEEPSMVSVLTTDIEESAHVESLEAIEEEVAKATSKAFETPEDDLDNNKKSTPEEATLVEETDVSIKANTIQDNDNDIIGIFGDEKDAETLTAELQQERENKEKKHECPKTSDEQSNVLPAESHEAPLSSTVPNYNDSIEKRLEIMESSETEPNTVSEFFGNFRASVETDTEITNEKTEKIEECPVEEEKIVENELNNLDQTKSSISSTSSSSLSSSSSSTSSSSTSTSTSLSTSLESNDSIEKEEKKEESLPKPLETSATEIILASSPCNPELPKPEVEQSNIVAEPSSVTNDLIKEPEVPPITLASPAKLPRKRDSESNGPIKLNGRVVLVVRRRRPVRLSNSNSVTVVSPKSTNVSVNSNELIETDAKTRICRTPRFKNS